MPQTLQLCSACHQHSATARDEDGSARCDRCDALRDDAWATPGVAARGWLTRLGRATRGGVLATALLGLAAGGVAACSDDGGKTDARVVQDGKTDGPASDMKVADAGTDAADAAAADSTIDLPPVTPYGISPVQIDDLV